MVCHVSSRVRSTLPGSPRAAACSAPVNVIKQAGTRILQRAPILEASLHEECSSQERGLTHVSYHQSGQCRLSDLVPTPPHSCYFLPFVYISPLSHEELHLRYTCCWVLFFFSSCSSVIESTYRKPKHIKTFCPLTASENTFMFILLHSYLNASRCN